MADNIFDVLFHPVRLKIIRSLTIYKELTSMQLFHEIGDVPQATLYRHINTLLDHDVLYVSEKRKARGNIENVFALNIKNTTLSSSDLDNFSKEERLIFFLKFVMMNYVEYEKYLALNQNNPDTSTYAIANLYLSDQELNELENEIQELVLSKVKNKPNSERKLRMLSTIIIPEILEREEK